MVHWTEGGGDGDGGRCRHSGLSSCYGLMVMVLHSGGLGIPERIGSYIDYGLSGNWASTRGNGSLVAGLSDSRSPLGCLL